NGNVASLDEAAAVDTGVTSRARGSSITDGSRTRAHATFRTTPICRLPSSPRRGRSTHVEASAPAAARRVLTPYNTPITEEALSMREASARDSNGSDAPMKKVGHRRLANRRSTSAAGAIGALPTRL